jgi:flagellar hook assembly protein FlgD
MPEGSHSARWDGRDEAGSEAGPGVYFLRMTAGTFTASRKMMLLR